MPGIAQTQATTKATSGGTTLTYAAIPADADQSMAVNTVYSGSIAAYSADRTFTLPGTAAVGDVCVIELTTGDTDFELLITAAAGDTLNGVAGGSEWSRLFITGEVVVMRCVVANATWIVEVDGRIPSYCQLRLSTDATGETASTTTYPTDKGGAWTEDNDVGDLGGTSDGRITIRRAGNYRHTYTGRPVNTITTGGNFILSTRLNAGATAVLYVEVAPGAAIQCSATATCVMPFAADDYVRAAFLSGSGSKGLDGNTSQVTVFSCVEVL